jgi:EmrB/QacA subfamily drug resistance transporter
MARQRSHLQLTFLVLLAAVAAYALLQSLVTPVLSTFQRELHTSQNTVTWVLTAYLLSASVFTPILGRVGDMVGKHRMLVVTLSALAAGSLLAALATSIGVMIVARVIQGMGGAVLPLTFGIIRDEFPHEKVAGAVGVAAALVAVGGGLGVVLAGPIVDALNYHWLFWIPMVIVLLAAVAAHWFVPESPVRTPGRVNVGAAMLLSGWLVALLVAVSEAPTWGWLSTKVIGLMALAIVLAVLWTWVELRSAEPLIDMRMMRIPAVWTTNLAALLFGVAMYSMFAFLPEFLQTPKSTGYGFGASITSSGLYLVPMTVVMFILGLVAGRLTAAYGAKAVMFIGSVITAVSFGILAMAHTQSWQIYLSSALLGVGIGLAFAAMSNLIVAAVPPEQTGVASGMNANIRTIGGSIGGAVMASVITSRPMADGFPRGAAYTDGFYLLALASVVAAVATLLIPKTDRSANLGEFTESDHAELGVVAGGTLVGWDAE